MTDFDSTVYSYRPHALSVQAVQITLDNARAVAAWCGGAVLELRLDLDEVAMSVGAMYVAHLGDWVVMDHSRAVEVMDTETFREAYRPLVPAEPTTWPTITGPIPTPRLETGL